MNITVLGAGNVGSLMAAEMASRGYNVTVYSSKPDMWNNEVTVYDSDDKIYAKGVLKNVTSNLETAVNNADVIWITMPSLTFNSLGKKLEKLVKSEQIIGVVPGSGGAEFAFKGCIDRGCVFFGLQRVHSIARWKEYGKAVYMLGRKSELYIGSIPSFDAQHICGIVASMLGIPCKALKNYLAVTLTPSNPILHTTRLYSMFKNYTEGVVYPRNILFYEEWDDASSDMLIKCDEEEQRLCSVIPIDLSEVVSLRIYYESLTASKLTEKIKSIKAFKGLTSPMKEVNDKWVPDLNSRYFTADFSYGLKVIIDFCAIFDIPKPNIDMVWNWYLKICPEAATYSFRLSLDQNELLTMYK